MKGRVTRVPGASTDDTGRIRRPLTPTARRLVFRPGVGPAAVDELWLMSAGAGGGTSVPIDPARTAELLGFDRPVVHSLDAVASRDLALRLLAGAAVAGVTLSRLAADLLLWTTAE